MTMAFRVEVNTVGPPGSSLLLLSLLLFLCCPSLRSYEAPVDKQDVFAKDACPAFLTYRNVAVLSGVTVELPCRCKPQTVTLTAVGKSAVHVPGFGKSSNHSVCAGRCRLRGNRNSRG